MSVAHETGEVLEPATTARGRAARDLMTVLALLAGLLAMHGLRGSHETCSSHVGSAAVGRSASTGTDQGQWLSTTVISLVDRARVTVVDRTAGTALMAATPLEHCHHGVETCVAVLTLLLLAPLLRWARRRSHPLVLTMPNTLMSWSGRGPPPWRAPTLFVLCQLRI